MHTVIVIAAGFGLLLACLGIGRAIGTARRGVLFFLPIWLAGAGANMYVGVARAGYTMTEELPVFLLVFFVPAGAAWLAWRALR